MMAWGKRKAAQEAEGAGPSDGDVEKGAETQPGERKGGLDCKGGGKEEEGR